MAITWGELNWKNGSQSDGLLHIGGFMLGKISGVSSPCLTLNNAYKMNPFVQKSVHSSGMGIKIYSKTWGEFN